MFKVFTLGIFLGLGAVIGLLWAVPAVHVAREASIVSVMPNGGTRERLQVQLPSDRLMAGMAGKAGYPEGIRWPEAMSGVPSQAEIFKVRDDFDRVIGVASRIAVGGDSPFVEWTVHLPARGTMYLVVDGSVDGGVRRGRLQGGTREFASRGGGATERFIADENGAPGEGTLELVTMTVSTEFEDEEPVAMLESAR